MKLAFVPAAVLAFVPAVASAQPGGSASVPPPVAPAAIAERGWLLEVRYQQADTLEIINAIGTPIQVPEPQGAIFAGYQRRRWSFVLGLELARQSWRPDAATAAVAYAWTTFFLVPGARVTLGRSADGRGELVGILDVGVGESRHTDDDGASDDDETLDRVKLQFGPGVRYWFASSFAVGASALIRHSRAKYVFRDPFSGNESGSDSTATGLVTSFSVTGVF
jgi:hypothetical protein